MKEVDSETFTSVISCEMSRLLLPRADSSKASIIFFNQPLKVLGAGFTGTCKGIHLSSYCFCCAPVFFRRICRQHRFMSEFNLESFACAPSLQQLKSLKKSQLQQIAKHFKLDFTTATRKDELFCLITEHLIDEELVLDTSIPSRRL